MGERRVLVCEDEDAIRDFVVIHLKRSGYDVFDVPNGDLAVRAWERGMRFDVAILDIMMPGTDGKQVCRYLRQHSASIGIIMLSAKSQEMDKVSCLMIGADDYVTKPFSPSELVARVDAVYRRVSMAHSEPNAPSDIQDGPFLLDSKSHTIYKNGEILELTQVEFHILEYFIRHSGSAIDRETLLRRIWGDGYYGDEKIVDVNIRRLRMKIEENPSDPAYIRTIWGYGYIWGKENAEEKEQAEEP